MRPVVTAFLAIFGFVTAWFLMSLVPIVAAANAVPPSATKRAASAIT